MPTRREYTDFKNGLRNASDYLDASSSVRTDLKGSVADVAKFAVSASYEVNLKEIICSLLSGLGLRLPNIQICLSINLKELLKTIRDLGHAVLDTLQAALESLDRALDSFLEHLGLDRILDRVSGVLSEIADIANMINFCSFPIDPVSIGNVLENTMESFLGAGENILNAIGSIAPDQIGGCILAGGTTRNPYGIGFFNTGIYTGGILKSISDNFGDIVAGTISSALISSITSESNRISNSIGSLIRRESKVPTSYSQGGSDLSTTPLVTTLTTAGSTTDIIHVASVEGLRPGMTVAIGTEIRRIISVLTNPNRIQLSSPLSTIPTEGTTVTASSSVVSTITNPGSTRNLLNVSSTNGFRPGMRIAVGSEIVTIREISTNTIRLTTDLPFAPPPGTSVIGSNREVNTGVGVLYNSNEEGITGAVTNASKLQALYQNLASYQVVHDDGTVYNNIFELFLEDDLLRILRRTPNPVPEVSEQIPVHNYCGQVIGYTKAVTQMSPEESTGTEPNELSEQAAQPGLNAGGRSTSPQAEALRTAEDIGATDGNMIWRGTWLSGNLYRIGHVIKRTDGIYLCLVENSDSTFINSNWESL